jgi:hypothetical protein
MDAIKKWWAAKGKAYATRALHTAWQGAGGLVIAAWLKVDSTESLTTRVRCDIL